MTATLTQPQVNPGVPPFEAFFASSRFRLWIKNLICVCTGVGHTLLHLSRRLNRYAHGKTRIAGYRIHRNLTVHPGNDAIHEVETQSGAVADIFRSKKGLKNP